MNAPRTVSLPVTTCLMMAVLFTANFERAAETAVDVRGGQLIPSDLSPAHCSFATGGPGFVPFALSPTTRINLFDPVHDADRPKFPGAVTPLLATPRVATDQPVDHRSNPVAPAESTPTKAGAWDVDVAADDAEVSALFAVPARAGAAKVEAARSAQGERGKKVYLGLCFACHQPDGRGLPGVFPMLARSDFMAADRQRAIRIVLHGLTGPVTVNRQTINSVMPAQETVLTNEQIADVLTYVFDAWGNPGGAFAAKQVAALRTAPP